MLNTRIDDWSIENKGQTIIPENLKPFLKTKSPQFFNCGLFIILNFLLLRNQFT
jgi:hypothetical protein